MQNANETNGKTYLGLLIAALAVAFASIFVRWAGDTPSLIIAFYRMLWATAIFAVLQLRQGSRIGNLSTAQHGWVIAAGLMLALHFATWIASLKFTSVAHSLMLYATGPVFALLLAPVVLGERSITPRSVAAVVLSLGGICTITLGDLQNSSGTLTGDLLALASALFIALYLLIGRKLKGDVALVPYLVRVYGSAALLLLVLSAVAGYPLLDYPGEAHFWMLMLALVPTGIGHSLFNWAARRIEVYIVNLAGLGEPLIATLLAYAFFSEVPGLWFYPGALLIFAGIALVVWQHK